MNYEYMSNGRTTDIVSFKYVYRYSLKVGKLFTSFIDNKRENGFNEK